MRVKRLRLLKTLSVLVLCGVSLPLLADDGFEVVHEYPHDQGAFTQGLIILDGHLYESTGLKGESSLRMLDLASGKILQYSALPAEYFGEGLTDWGSTLVQITWQNHTGFVYDRFSFRRLKTFQYTGEGWGLTHDSKNLILSDGTSSLRFLDPATFKEVRRVTVRWHGAPVDKLNELEWVKGEVYANVWYSNRVARIAAESGRVLGWIDLSGLAAESGRESNDAVLNGIAYDAQHDRLFVTGKLWPKIFEIRVVPETKKSSISRPTKK